MSENHDPPKSLTIHIDGAARGNPGPAGAGVVIADEQGQSLFEGGFFLGQATNNVAEYRALLRALQWAQQLPNCRLEIYTDSELLLRQLKGEYRVRSPQLRELFVEAMQRLGTFAGWSITHIRRQHNKSADRLANLAIDAQTDVQDAASWLRLTGQ